MTNKIVDFIKDENLRIKLQNIIRKVWAEFEPGNVGDTLTGFRHFEAVDINLATILAETGRATEMTATELFLLGASAYLHDLLKSSAAWGFLTHGEKMMDALADRPDLYGLDHRGEAIPIGFISAAHSRRGLDNTEWGRVPEDFLTVSGAVINLRELAAIFLLADSLDTTTQRAPEMMKHIHYPEGFTDEETEGKWTARQAITGWCVRGGKIALQAYPQSFDEREAVRRARTLMESDLSEIKPTLLSLKIPCELKLEIEDALLKVKAVASIHEAAPFKGMDYYDESDQRLFMGRKEDVERVEGYIAAYPIAVFQGNSGVGKTSLIRAGLFPILKQSGWECVYLRPLVDSSSLLETIKRSYGVEAKNLATAFRKLDEKLKKKLLVVIDQFEDVLNWPAELFPEFILDLSSIHGLSNPKLLIGVRSDALCDLNRKIFKEVMTSGFPTVELGGLDRAGAREALKTGFEVGKMTLHPPELLEKILTDLIALGPFEEIYPPHLQMVGEELCKHADKERNLILADTYYKLGSAQGIAAAYLIRKLDDFGDDREDAITVLKCLVSSRGRKAPQKSVSEIMTETGLPKSKLEELLKRLVDERMVRKLAGADYEIIHDHFGKLVNEEFVGKEERDIKYLREQLHAAIAAYERNKALMQGEILAELYLNREKIPVDESAYPVLLATWCAHPFPVWYWLRNAGNTKIIEMSIELCEHPREEVQRGASRLLSTALVTLGDKYEAQKLFTHETRAVRGAVVEAFSKLVSREDLSWLRERLNDKDWEVQRAAAKAFSELVSLVSREDLPLVKEFLYDKDGDVRKAATEAISKLGSREDLPLVRALLRDKDEDVRRAAVHAISTLGSREDLPLVRELIKDKDWQVRGAAVVTFFKLVNREDLPLVRALLRDNAEDVRRAAIEAFSKLVNREDLPLVRELFKDKFRYVRMAAVQAISMLGSREDVPLVREHLNDKARDVREAAVEAFSKFISRDGLTEARVLLNEKDRGVREAAAKAFSTLASREDLPMVRELLYDHDEYVRKAAEDAFSKLVSREDLPMVRELLYDGDWYVRKAAEDAFSKLVSREDLLLVKELLKHEYLDVRETAVEAIKNLAGEEDLDDLAKALEEQVNALTAIDWKVFSPYSSSKKQG